VIRSTANPRVRWVRELQARRRVRQEAGVFVLEGTRLAEEALAAGAETRLVLHGPDLDPRARQALARFARQGVEVLAVAAKVLEACSAAQTAPGLLIVAARPDPPLPDPVTLAVVVDGVNDPGNLGSLMRTCVAAGVDGMLLTPGSVDVYNPKVVRGAMGAHFRLPVRTLEAGPASSALAGLPIWLAEAGEGRPYIQVDWRRPAALVVGNEARGSDPAWKERAAGLVHVPMRPGVESLNAAVAAAVILFEAARQRGSR
jgi:RNA methyltransferase, TrmH family